MNTNEHKLNENAVPKRRWLKVSISIFIILSFLGGLGYIAANMLVGPSEGTIVNSIPDAAPAKRAVELEQFEGLYVTFALPSSFKPQPAKQDEANNPNSLETHTFVASGLMNKVLTLTVTKLPTGKLEDDSSYYMRSLHPEIYKLIPQVISSEKVIVAESSKDSQQSAFWVHAISPAQIPKSSQATPTAAGLQAGNKLLTFTISSVSIDSQATADEYKAMLNSIKWR